MTTINEGVYADESRMDSFFVSLVQGKKGRIIMMTWHIMMGAQLISMAVSAAVVVAFMLKKEPLDATEKKTLPVKVNTETSLASGTI